MGLVNFGQADDGVIQMAYVVENVHQAMDAWVKKLTVGPWFLLDTFTGIAGDELCRTHDGRAHSGAE